VHNEVRIPVRSDGDVVTARQRGRELARGVGLSATDATLLATAISEVARNIISYAVDGEITIAILTEGDRYGIRVVATDSGPGIANVHQALQDGFSTSHGMGFGLPGARRLVDDFHIESRPGRGTTVTLTKWAASG
jgi:serine/threonine-protein kinase RsbT